MCFVSVSKNPDMYRHVKGQFVHTIDVKQEHLDEIAKKLGVGSETAKQWKPGKLHIVNIPAK